MASYDLRFLWSHPAWYILQAVRRLSFCHIGYCTWQKQIFSKRKSDLGFGEGVSCTKSPGRGSGKNEVPLKSLWFSANYTKVVYSKRRPNFPMICISIPVVATSFERIRCSAKLQKIVFLLYHTVAFCVTAELMDVQMDRKTDCRVNLNKPS